VLGVVCRGMLLVVESPLLGRELVVVCSGMLLVVVEPPLAGNELVVVCSGMLLVVESPLGSELGVVCRGMLLLVTVVVLCEGGGRVEVVDCGMVVDDSSDVTWLSG
jgi:hypothetical protein